MAEKSKEELMESIKGGLIVSCQAQADEPLNSPFIMAKMALAAKMGGAIAIRSEGIADINAIKSEIDLPIIGLIKKKYDTSEVFITPTIQQVKELINSSCDFIAVDATNRARPAEEDLIEMVNLIHEHNKLAVADISTVEEALYAQSVNFDIVSTTLSGYTDYSSQQEEPDYKLVKQLVKKLEIPVIAEGRINTPKQLKKMLLCKPYAVVIGSAITRPQLITKRFVEVYNHHKK